MFKGYFPLGSLTDWVTQVQKSIAQSVMCVEQAIVFVMVVVVVCNDE